MTDAPEEGNLSFPTFSLEPSTAVIVKTSPSRSVSFDNVPSSMNSARTFHEPRSSVNPPSPAGVRRDVPPLLVNRDPVGEEVLPR